MNWSVLTDREGEAVPTPPLPSSPVGSRGPVRRKASKGGRGGPPPKLARVEAAAPPSPRKLRSGGRPTIAPNPPGDTASAAATPARVAAPVARDSTRELRSSTTTRAGAATPAPEKKDWEKLVGAVFSTYELPMEQIVFCENGDGSGRRPDPITSASFVALPWGKDGVRGSGLHVVGVRHLVKNPASYAPGVDRTTSSSCTTFGDVLIQLYAAFRAQAGAVNACIKLEPGENPLLELRALRASNLPFLQGTLREFEKSQEYEPFRNKYPAVARWLRPSGTLVRFALLNGDTLQLPCHLKRLMYEVDFNAGASECAFPPCPTPAPPIPSTLELGKVRGEQADLLNLLRKGGFECTPVEGGGVRVKLRIHLWNKHWDDGYLNTSLLISCSEPAGSQAVSTVTTLMPSRKLTGKGSLLLVHATSPVNADSIQKSGRLLPSDGVAWLTAALEPGDPVGENDVGGGPGGGARGGRRRGHRIYKNTLGGGFSTEYWDAAKTSQQWTSSLHTHPLLAIEQALSIVINSGDLRSQRMALSGKPLQRQKHVDADNVKYFPGIRVNLVTNTSSLSLLFYVAPEKRISSIMLGMCSHRFSPPSPLRQAVALALAKTPITGCALLQHFGSTVTNRRLLAIALLANSSNPEPHTTAFNKVIGKPSLRLDAIREFSPQPFDAAKAASADIAAELLKWILELGLPPGRVGRITSAVEKGKKVGRDDLDFFTQLQQELQERQQAREVQQQRQRALAQQQRVVGTGGSSTVADAAARAPRSTTNPNKGLPTSRGATKPRGVVSQTQQQKKWRRDHLLNTSSSEGEGTPATPTKTCGECGGGPKRGKMVKCTNTECVWGVGVELGGAVSTRPRSHPPPSLF